MRSKIIFSFIFCNERLYENSYHFMTFYQSSQKVRTTKSKLPKTNVLQTCKTIGSCSGCSRFEEPIASHT